MSDLLSLDGKWIALEEARNWIAFRSFGLPPKGPCRWVELMHNPDDEWLHLDSGRMELAMEILFERGGMDRIRFVGRQGRYGEGWDPGTFEEVPSQISSSFLKICEEDNGVELTVYFVKDVAYSHIIVLFDDLIREFPEQKDAISTATPDTGTAAPLDEIQTRKPVRQFSLKGNARGRKHKWPWHDFWREVVLRADGKSLPETQAKLVAQMSEWFIQNFDEAPSESDLKDVLQPIYRVKRESRKSRPDVDGDISA